MKRKEKLEVFLVKYVGRKGILSNECFKTFLEIDKHSPSIPYNTPIKLFQYSDLSLGVRDFIYIDEKKLTFTACSDINITSRLEAYITNENLPWEKKSEIFMFVGIIFAFKKI